MTDPILTEEPEEPVLAFVVLAVDEAAGTAQVRFLNPDHAGGPMTIRTRPRPNPAFGEPDEPEVIEEEYEVDEDPNAHVVKTVRVPIGPDGQVDTAAWLARLADQARGVKVRMDEAKASLPAPGALSSLIED